MSRAFRDAKIADDDRKKISRFVEVDFSKSPSLTIQSPTEDVDINKIVAKIIKGHSVLTSSGQPFYGDVSEFSGLQDALIKVQEADDLFLQFPANVRERFNNDPVEFVQFFEDPKNLDEAIKLGLVSKKPDPEPVPSPAPAPAPESAKK